MPRLSVSRRRGRRWPWLATVAFALTLAACGGGATATIAPHGPTPRAQGAASAVATAPPVGTSASPTRAATPVAAVTATGRTTGTSAPGGAIPAAGAPRPVTLAVPKGQGQTQATEQRTLTLPEGFQIDIFAAGLGRARFMAWSPEGALVISEQGTTDGKVSVLTDPDKDGTADQRTVFAQGLRNPHGLAFRDGYLYVAEETRVVRFRWQGGGAASGSPEVLIASLPTGGHASRTIGFGPDGKLYLTIGSSCNVCNESDARRAAIWQYNADGSGGRLYARGLRNAVGFVWRPGSDEIWATNNGRDGLGDNIPPETVNLVRDGNDFGWPYCHNGVLRDQQFGAGGSCERVTKPAIEMQAHSAPLGLAFYTGSAFPADYSGDLFVAFHGSWNRSVPTGYKVVRARFQDGKPTGQVEDFVTGWLPDNGRSSWGRPVDLIVGPNGDLYLSDDALGVVYRISYGH